MTDLREEVARKLAVEDGYREPQKHHYREADAAIAIVLERAAEIADSYGNRRFRHEEDYDAGWNDGINDVIENIVEELRDLIHAFKKEKDDGLA